MDRRRKILIAVLTVVFLGYFGDLAYRRLYEEPLASAGQRQAALEQELRKGQLMARRQQNLLARRDELKARSLPRNLEIAVTEYRGWLLRILAEEGLQQASLDSSSPTRFRQLYDRIDFTLRTRGTLSQVIGFLHRFYGTCYLHKIRSLSLTPSADGELDISLTIETLSIPSIASADRLPAMAMDERLAVSDQYAVIYRRNLFRPGAPPAAQIKLSAITSDVKNRRCAWLSFLKTGESRILSEGETFSFDGSHVEIHKITSDAVEIRIDGRERRVAMGSTLE